MNLADASLAQLRAAFLNDAREFLLQIDHALLDAARGDDAPQAFGQAGEALRGLSIGADFLGLGEVCALCREAQQQLLIQLPSLAPARAADTRALNAIAARLHAALEADRSVAAPSEPVRAPGDASVAAVATAEYGASAEAVALAAIAPEVVPQADAAPGSHGVPEPDAAPEAQAAVEPQAEAPRKSPTAPSPEAAPEAEAARETETASGPEPAAAAEAEAEAPTAPVPEPASEPQMALGAEADEDAEPEPIAALAIDVETIADDVSPAAPQPSCVPLLQSLLQRVDALADGLREQRNAIDALRPPSSPSPPGDEVAVPEPPSAEIEVALATLGPWWLAWPASATFAAPNGDARRIAFGGSGELWMYGRSALREVQLPPPWPPPRGALRWPLDLPAGGVALRVDALHATRRLRFDALPRALAARTGVRAVAALDSGDAGQLPVLWLDAQAFGLGALEAGETLRDADAASAGANAWLAFDIGPQCCGVDLRALCEIALPRPPVHPLPGADAQLPGVAFWRGAALPLLDLGALLDSSPSLERAGAQLIVCEADGERWGWIVDRVRGMRDLGRGGAIAVGAGLPPPWDAARELLGGHGDEVCALLQPAALLRHALAPNDAMERR